MELQVHETENGCYHLDVPPPEFLTSAGRVQLTLGLERERPDLVREWVTWIKSALDAHEHPRDESRVLQDRLLPSNLLTFCEEVWTAEDPVVAVVMHREVYDDVRKFSRSVFKVSSEVSPSPLTLQGYFLHRVPLFMGLVPTGMIAFVTQSGTVSWLRQRV